MDENFGIIEVHQRSYYPGRLWIVTKQPEKLEKALFQCNIVRKPRRIWANEGSPGEFLDWSQSLPKAGQWVRATRGLYKGDLALVLKDSSFTDVLQIAVVPRILSVPLPQRKAKHPEATPLDKKRKISSKSSRPAPCMFDPQAAAMQSNAHKQDKNDNAKTQNIVQELYRHIPSVCHYTFPDGTPRSLHEGEIPQDVCYRYNEVMYVGGLLIKNICGSEYQLERSPLKHELVPFITSRVWPDVILPQFVFLHWSTGDKVTVHGADLNSETVGTIVSTDSIAGEQTALVLADDDHSGVCIVAKMPTLHRRWQVGDGVKVIAGEDIGKHGLVLDVEEDPPYIQFLEDNSVTSVRFISHDYWSTLRVTYSSDPCSS